MPTLNHKPRLVLITGPSGAGKSSALNILEDIGFFCVDNLPIALLPTFLDLCKHSAEDISKIAMVVDVREREFLKDLPPILEEIKEKGYNAELIYLESSDEALIRRFKETRRRHPLVGEGPLLKGISKEREMLLGLKEMADKIIDTSDFTVHRLKEVFHDYFFSIDKENKMAVNLLSFSYKYGVPSDADIMFDVRFLPNPFFEEGLRELTGDDNRVKEYILRHKETRVFLKKMVSLLTYLIPLYIKEGKPYITIAFGCTGGRHRSVCIVNYLAEELRSNGDYIINKRHRDLGR